MTENLVSEETTLGWEDELPDFNIEWAVQELVLQALLLPPETLY